MLKAKMIRFFSCLLVAILAFSLVFSSVLSVYALENVQPSAIYSNYTDNEIYIYHGSTIDYHVSPLVSSSFRFDHAYNFFAGVENTGLVKYGSNRGFRVAFSLSNGVDRSMMWRMFGKMYFRMYFEGGDVGAVIPSTVIVKNFKIEIVSTSGDKIIVNGSGDNHSYADFDTSLCSAQLSDCTFYITVTFPSTISTQCHAFGIFFSDTVIQYGTADQINREQERQEYTQQGQDNVSSVNGSAPDNSGGFVSALGSFVNSMSYNGTVCKWKFPSIKLPAINGVMSETTLNAEQDIDFGFWVGKIPSNILEIVQILCTIALIVYCFKELYSTIQYVLTLKGGGDNG